MPLPPSSPPRARCGGEGSARVFVGRRRSSAAFRPGGACGGGAQSSKDSRPRHRDLKPKNVFMHVGRPREDSRLRSGEAGRAAARARRRHHAGHSGPGDSGRLGLTHGRLLLVRGDAIMAQPFDESNIELSPDPGRRTRDIWVQDLARGVRTRFTFDSAEERSSRLVARLDAYRLQRTAQGRRARSVLEDVQRLERGPWAEGASGRCRQPVAHSRNGAARPRTL
jgi:hypothetical protein